MSDKSFEAYHTGGHKPCTKLAFTFIDHPSERVGPDASSNIIMANDFPLGEMMYCGSCEGIVGGVEYNEDRSKMRNLAPNQCLTLKEVEKVSHD